MGMINYKYVIGKSVVAIHEEYTDPSYNPVRLYKKSDFERIVAEDNAERVERLLLEPNTQPTPIGSRDFGDKGCSWPHLKRFVAKFETDPNYAKQFSSVGHETAEAV